MYNKIFTKILDSSIWLETDATRIVWLTLIASMDESGFCHFASPGNLANRARVPIEATVDAIKVLESPDPNSGDSSNEGRRIERVPGGWMVLNAPKYRELVTRAVNQEKTRLRVAAFRQKRRELSPTQLTSKPCDCCGQEFPDPINLYAVQDHHHESGLNRGIICQSCNKVVGLIEKQKVCRSEKLDICYEYIRKWAGNLGVTMCNVPVTPSEALSESKAESISPKPKLAAVSTSLALPFASEAFAESWSNWIGYRKERHLSAYVPRGLSGLFGKLTEWGEARSVAAIAFSIEQNYQGIFEPGERQKPKASRPLTPEAEKRLNAF